MQFNPGDGSGLVDEINDICNSDNNSFPLASKVRRINSALDRYASLALRYDKSWTFDDFNRTDLPIATADIKAGQVDYPFAAELLAVKSLFVRNENNGKFNQLNEETHPENTFLGEGNRGLSTTFRLVGNSILLDFIPDKDIDGGLKVHFVRNLLKFAVTDTTKEPGIPSVFHTWLAQFASIPYLIENQKGNKNDIVGMANQMEDPSYPSSIPAFIATRNAARKPRLVFGGQNNQ